MDRLIIDATHSLVIGFQQETLLRRSFDDLATSVFGLSFEGWYDQGLWRDNYIPYSIVEGDQIIANVSVSPMEIDYFGERLDLLQFGTVMTRRDRRGQGWIRLLMERAMADWMDKVHGMFLYANDSVLELYPLFGFQAGIEFEFRKRVDLSGPIRAQRIDMTDAQQQKKLKAAIENSCVSSRLWLKNAAPLALFHVAQAMMDRVFFIGDLNAWVIAELDEGQLIVHQIFAPSLVDPEDVFRSFGEVAEVRLGFTPLDAAGFSVRPIIEEDSTFFATPDLLAFVRDGYLRLPSLAHT